MHQIQVSVRTTDELVLLVQTCNELCPCKLTISEIWSQSSVSRRVGRLKRPISSDVRSGLRSAIYIQKPGMHLDMNRLKIEVYAISVLHVGFWLYVLFAWLLPSPIKHIQTILLVLLPLAFIVQSLPCHLLVQEKILRIDKQKDDFPPSQTESCHTEIFIRDRIANNLNMDPERVHDLMSRMLYCEEKLEIPRAFGKLKNYIDLKSMLNPVDPHGMIIIGYLINTIAMKVRTGRA